MSRFNHAFSFDGVQSKRFFAIGVFAGLESREVDVGVGAGNGQVEDDLNVVTGQQLVDRH